MGRAKGKKKVSPARRGGKRKPGRKATPGKRRTLKFEGKPPKLRLHVKIAAVIGAITPAVDSIMRLVGEMGCGSGHEFEIETALREALANAIIHGARKDPRKSVDCFVICEEDRRILIVVRDPGKGFDPVKVPLPTKGENLYSEHGRGVYLINQLMDEVRFRKGGREIHMKKQLRGRKQK